MIPGFLKIAACFPMLAGAFAGAPARADDGKKWTRASAWERAGPTLRNEAYAYGKDYLDFLGRAKTERETVALLLERARAAGFAEQGAATSRRALRAGDKLVFSAHGKIAALVVVGERPLSEGARFVASHVDAVRIDLKPQPVYEDTNLVLLQTQYYGRISFAQWMARPLALHGVAFREDGSKVTLRIGSEPGDPVLVIPDVLVHLRSKVAGEAGDRLPAEKLDPIAGSLPAQGTGEGEAAPARLGRFKEAFLELLATRWKLSPQHLRAAELTLVPAEPPRSVGLDEGLVGGYGQDGRAGVYASLRAITELGPSPKHTAIAVFFDRAEVGGTGNTGGKSDFLRGVVATLLRAQGGEAKEQRLREAFSKSTALSAHATSAAEPLFKKLYERQNVAFLGGGVVVDGLGNAELRAAVGKTLTTAGVSFQVGEFSRVDAGKTGEGSLVRHLSRLGIDAMSLAIPVVSLHTPFELASKIDLWSASRAYRAFLKE